MITAATMIIATTTITVVQAEGLEAVTTKRFAFNQLVAVNKMGGASPPFSIHR